jgi:hypothetical protein
MATGQSPSLNVAPDQQSGCPQNQHIKKLVSSGVAETTAAAVCHVLALLFCGYEVMMM